MSQDPLTVSIKSSVPLKKKSGVTHLAPRSNNAVSNHSLCPSLSLLHPHITHIALHYYAFISRLWHQPPAATGPRATCLATLAAEWQPFLDQTFQLQPQTNPYSALIGQYKVTGLLTESMRNHPHPTQAIKYERDNSLQEKWQD